MMDKTKEYMLQCEKAVEIQKEWEHEILDIIYNKRKKSVSFIGTSYNKKSVSGMRLGSSAYIPVWLPRQDQLQGMLPLKLEEFGALLAIKKFVDIVNKESTGYYFKFISMEQLWLAFVMKEKFNKVWKGEDWIKDKP